jgi:hydroxymethylbilane synthase
MGLSDRISYAFKEHELLPAIGQGALGLEVRSADERAIAAVEPLNDGNSFHRSMAERAMLRRLFAGCLSPVGAVSSVNIDSEELSLTGVVLSRDGRTRIESSTVGPIVDSELLGIEVAEKLLTDGADKLLNGN